MLLNEPVFETAGIPSVSFQNSVSCREDSPFLAPGLLPHTNSVPTIPYTCREIHTITCSVLLRQVELVPGFNCGPAQTPAHHRQTWQQGSAGHARPHCRHDVESSPPVRWIRESAAPHKTHGYHMDCRVSDSQLQIPHPVGVHITTASQRSRDVRAPALPKQSWMPAGARWIDPGSCNFGCWWKVTPTVDQACGLGSRAFAIPVCSFVVRIGGMEQNEAGWYHHTHHAPKSLPGVS